MSFLLPHLLTKDIEQDPVHPSEQRGFSFEAMNRFQGLEKCFLDHVMGVRLSTAEQKSRTNQVGAVHSNGFFKRWKFSFFVSIPEKLSLFQFRYPSICSIYPDLGSI